MIKTLLLLLVLVVGCESTQDVEIDIKELKTKRQSYATSVEILGNKLVGLNEEIKILDKKLYERKIYMSGRVPKYVIKLQFRIAHTASLSLDDSSIDHQSKTELNIYVSRDQYYSLKIGDNLVDKSASSMRSFSRSIKMYATVVDKHME